MSIHINRPSSTRFIARVRGRGAKNYKLIGKPTRSEVVAIKRMAKAFADSSFYKRGDVIMVADYYDPISVVEITR